MKQYVIDGYLEKIKRLEKMNKDLMKREKLLMDSDRARYCILSDIEKIADPNNYTEIDITVKFALIKSLASSGIREGL